MSNQKKLILVIGATGAQGIHIIKALLKPNPDGTPSPYSVRALTRDPTGRRAQDLAAQGVELVKGSFMEFSTVLKALEGAYGAFVNTDGFTVGEMKEIYAGMRIFELAKQTGTLRHYVWSSVPHALKSAGYNPDYAVGHMDGKARVTDWMKAQASEEAGMTWTSISCGIYMDMIKMHMLGPLNIREDGTRVFANPLDNGPLPLIALDDLGFWVRYTFDHRAESSGKDWHVASDYVSYETLPAIFTKVTGLPAVYKPMGIDEWFELVEKGDKPVANERQTLEGEWDLTWAQNFSRWWRWWRESKQLWPLDMEWIRSVNPGSLSLEKYLRKQNWDGKADGSVLKDNEDNKGPGFKWDKIKKL